MTSPSAIFLRRFLAGGAMLGAAWMFHSRWTVPLQRDEAECLQAIADLRQRLSEAKVTIEETTRRERTAAAASGVLDSLHADIPKEPTEVWLPVRLRTRLKDAGVVEAGIRVNSAIPEPGVPGYERTFWHLNLPRQNGMRSINGILLSLAEIERMEPFVRILDVSLSSGAEEPHWPAGGFNVTALVPK